MESKHRAALTRLQHFLAAAFSADELRRFVWEVGGQDLVTGLPEIASLSALAFEVTTALDRRGALNRAFFRALIDARPGRAAEIHDLAALFDVALAGARSIVLLYAVDGASAASELARHLRAHQRGGLVDVHMVQVSAMEEGDDPRFHRAVCAILVTPRIVDEIDSSTVKWLLHRNIVGDLRLQPVIVASIPWMKSPLGRLLGRSPSLPSDGRAIEEWMKSEAGWDPMEDGGDRRAGGDELSEQLEARLALITRIDVDEEPVLISARKGEDEEVAGGSQEAMELVLGDVPGHSCVGAHVVLWIGDPWEVGADEVADAGVSAVAADDPGAAEDLLALTSAQPHDSAVCVGGEVDELDAALDRATEVEIAGRQRGLSVALGARHHIGVAGVEAREGHPRDRPRAGVDVDGMDAGAAGDDLREDAGSREDLERARLEVGGA
jgi:hypothetical protein